MKTEIIQTPKAVANVVESAELANNGYLLAEYMPRHELEAAQMAVALGLLFSARFGCGSLAFFTPKSAKAHGVN